MSDDLIAASAERLLAEVALHAAEYGCDPRKPSFNLDILTVASSVIAAQSRCERLVDAVRDLIAAWDEEQAAYDSSDTGWGERMSRSSLARQTAEDRLRVAGAALALTPAPTEDVTDE